MDLPYFPIESLADTGSRYDVIVASEVIEHVTDTGSFMGSLESMLNSNGKLIISTVNRTNKSYLTAIVGAEYVLGLVAKGTHDWNKFITPDELSEMISKQNLFVDNISGMSYNPITQSASFTEDLSVNYFYCASKM